MAEIKIKADSNGGTVSLKGPASTPGDAAIQLTLPVDDGTSGQYLKTDGSGALSWATVDTSIADDSIAEAKLDIHNAPSGTDKFLGYTSNGMEWAAIAAGGITEADIWRLTTHITGSQTPITSDNWERSDNASYSKVGTGFSAPSSGVFAFPATGIWWIKFQAHTTNSGTGTKYVNIGIEVTTDGGSNWDNIAYAQQGISGDPSGNAWGSHSCDGFFDVTNLTNCKIRFRVHQQQSDSQLYAETGHNSTYIRFIKLADT